MRQRRSSVAGFTLIEALTALFVFSTAAVGLSLLNRDSVSATRLVRAKFLARTVAENQAVDVFLERNNLEQGVQSGIDEQLGIRFEWTRQISASPRDGLLIVEISVREEDDELVLAQLSTLRAEP